MRSKHNPLLSSHAREMRKAMTKEERRLWYEFLRTYPIRFYRQKVLGYYIADFYCAEAKLVVELDGSQHYQTGGEEADAQRTAFLNGYGIQVLRIQNVDVNQNFYGVCTCIDTTVKARLK